MRCVYCHNPDIVTGWRCKDEAELLSGEAARQINRRGFSGGEATLYAGLVDIARKVRGDGLQDQAGHKTVCA